MISFAKAVPLPYIYSPSHKFHHPRLVVTCSSTDAATGAGYAKAVDLPYQIHSGCNSHIQIPSSLVVYMSSDTDEAAEAGYANAVAIPVHDGKLCIRDLQMLDTEYAASLVDFPRFW